jgi:hypothetical protein
MINLGHLTGTADWAAWFSPMQEDEPSPFAPYEGTGIGCAYLRRRADRQEHQAGCWMMI